MQSIINEMEFIMSISLSWVLIITKKPVCECLKEDPSCIELCFDIQYMSTLYLGF